MRSSVVPATSDADDGNEEELDPVVQAADTWRTSGGQVLVIAIDGHGASGKSTYAAALAGRLGASLVHTDDFFQPSSRRATGRPVPDDPLGRYYDWRRLRAEALAPLLARREAMFRRYDWELDEVCGPDVLVAPRPVMVLEGVFSSAPQLEDLVDRAVLMETPENERLRRLRIKVAPEDWDDDWLLAEQVYFTFIRPPAFFDLVLSGVGARAPDRVL